MTVFDAEQILNKPRAKTARGEYLYPFLLEYSSRRGIHVCGIVTLVVDPKKDCPTRIDAIPAVVRLLSDRKEVVSSRIYEWLGTDSSQSSMETA